MSLLSMYSTFTSAPISANSKGMKKSQTSDIASPICFCKKIQNSTTFYPDDLVTYGTLSVLGKVDSAIHWIVIFSRSATERHKKHQGY